MRLRLTSKPSERKRVEIQKQAQKNLLYSMATRGKSTEYTKDRKKQKNKGRMTPGVIILGIRGGHSVSGFPFTGRTDPFLIKFLLIS